MTDIEVTTITDPADDPLTEGELAFRDLQRNPSAWREWCAKRRERWARTAAGLLAARKVQR